MTEVEVNLTQIVPTLPPDINGLGDFATALARQLQGDWSLSSRFIVANPSWAERTGGTSQSVNCLAQRRAPELLAALPRHGPLILNYEGYGYAQRGWPRWLYRALRGWRQQRQQPLLTIFHEVYPYHAKPPWTSSFWLAPAQRRLAADLFRLSDRALTSKQSYAALLRKLAPDSSTPIDCRPVFSTIGEPSTLPAHSQRRRRLIVFGHPNSRSLTYQRDRHHLERACRTLAITEICDVGTPTGLVLPSIGGLVPHELGVLPAQQVSALMLDAIAGFLSFIAPEYLAKSTVFAAYAAHGLTPVLNASQAQPTDGLFPNRHYWLAGATEAMLTIAAAEAIARHAHAWYHTHRLATYAQTVANCLGFTTARSSCSNP